MILLLSQSIVAERCDHTWNLFTAIWWNFIVNFIRNHVGCTRCRQIQVGFLLSWAQFLQVLLQMQSKYSTSFHFYLYAHIKCERKKNPKFCLCWHFLHWRLKRGRQTTTAGERVPSELHSLETSSHAFVYLASVISTLSIHT